MSTPAKTSSGVGSAVLCVGLVLLFVGERVFAHGSSQSLLTAAGGLTLLGSLGLRLRALAAASGDARAVELRLLGAGAGVVLAMLIYGLTTEAGLTTMGWEGPAATRAAGALGALWVSILTVSLCALLFGELVYLSMPVARSVELRRVRTSMLAGMSLGLAAVFLFSINFVATERDVRKDVSYFKTTRPSDGTRSMVGKLDRPLRAVLFYQRNNDVLGRLEPYFASLASASEKLSYEVMDVALVPDLAKAHRVRGNGQVLLLRGEGDKAKGEVFKVGSELTAARKTLKKLDAEFQKAFTKLVRPELSLHITVGHGEHNAKQSEGAAPGPDGVKVMRNIFTRLNLKTKNLGIAEGLGNQVPSEASAVIVVGPKQAFLPEEAESLLSYVRKGGRLMLMLDPDRDLGLQPLLQGLGVERLPGTLVSLSHHMRRTYGLADKVLVYSNTYTSHPSVTTVSRHQKEVATVFARGGGLGRGPLKGLDPAPKVVFPLRSTTDFWRDLDGDLTLGKAEKREALNMVAAVTLPRDKGEEGRVIVIADGDFMTDKLAGNNGNMLLFVDALAWLVGNEDLTGEVSSEEDVPIEHSRDEDRAWFYATTVAVPAPVFLFGVLVARRRRRRTEAKS